MDHLFIHSAQVLRRPVTGSEDGTPTRGDWAPIPWVEDVMVGAGRLDSPRETTVEKADGTKVIVQKSTWLTTVNCPGREKDRLKVTTGLGTQEWQIDGAAEAEGMHGPHHIELNVSREVGRR